MQVNEKHAYLIMAHGHFDLLKKLLVMLDDERNDIFLHIDKKAGKIGENDFSSLLEKSKLFFTKRISVFWGHSSQIDCEMVLLKACVKEGKYKYVHLISGVDLPIKSQNEIHEFFEKNNGKQFLQVGCSERHLYRLSRYFFMLNHPKSRLKPKIDSITEILCYKFKINRLKKYGDMTVVKTANWFSVTGECAQYLVSKKKFIKKLTRHTVCADEMFLGTVLYSSPYWKDVYNPEFSWDGHMRYIDRIRNVGASPHTFTMDDKESIDNSEMLFARKFDETVDSQIIEYIFNKYKN